MAGGISAFFDVDLSQLSAVANAVADLRGTSTGYHKTLHKTMRLILSYTLNKIAKRDPKAVEAYFRRTFTGMGSKSSLSAGRSRPIRVLPAVTLDTVRAGIISGRRKKGKFRLRKATISKSRSDEWKNTWAVWYALKHNVYGAKASRKAGDHNAVYAATRKMVGKAKSSCGYHRRGLQPGFQTFGGHMYESKYKFPPGSAEPSHNINSHTIQAEFTNFARAIIKIGGINAVRQAIRESTVQMTKWLEADIQAAAHRMIDRAKARQKRAHDRGVYVEGYVP